MEKLTIVEEEAVTTSTPNKNKNNKIVSMLGKAIHGVEEKDTNQEIPPKETKKEDKNKKKAKNKKRKKKDEAKKKKKAKGESSSEESEKEEKKKKQDKDKGDIIADKFVMLMEMGKGAFGQIFLTYNKEDDEEVATKKETKKVGKNSAPQLKMEFIVYKTLLHISQPSASPAEIQIDYSGKHRIPQEEVQGIPKFHGYGECTDFYYLIISLLGPNLVELFNFCNCRKFTISTVCMLAIQMLNRIEYFHKHHYLHRDIKPENFLIGCGDNSNVVHLIDYGLCKKYKDPKTHQHIPYREGRLLTGTARYVSINTHLGIEQSRRDDLESIGYVLVFFLKGSLPWQGLKTNIDKYNKIMEKKLQIPTEILCYGLPDEITYYLNYCKSLRFEDRPDYDYLRGLFVKLLYSCVSTYSLTKEHLKFDWCFEDTNTIWMLYNKKKIAATNSMNVKDHKESPMTGNAFRDFNPMKTVESEDAITPVYELEKKPTLGGSGSTSKLNLLRAMTKGGNANVQNATPLPRLDEEAVSSDGSPKNFTNQNNMNFANSQMDYSENLASCSNNSEATVAIERETIGFNKINKLAHLRETQSGNSESGEDIDLYVNKLLAKKGKINYGKVEKQEIIETQEKPDNNLELKQQKKESLSNTCISMANNSVVNPISQAINNAVASNNEIKDNKNQSKTDKVGKNNASASSKQVNNSNNSNNYNIQIGKSTLKNEEKSDNTVEVKPNAKNFNNINQYLNDYSEEGTQPVRNSNGNINGIPAAVKKKTVSSIENKVEKPPVNKNFQEQIKTFEVKYTFQSVDSTHEREVQQVTKKSELSIEAQILKKKKTEKEKVLQTKKTNMSTSNPQDVIKLSIMPNSEILSLTSMETGGHNFLKTPEGKERRKSKIVEMNPNEMKFSKDQLIKISNEPIQNYYTIMGDLGHGSYGSVKRVRHKQLGEDRAMKIVKKKSESSHNEIEILKKISHPNIIAIYEIFEDSKNYYIMTEFLEGGELFEMITSQGSFSEFDAAKIIKQILNTVNYLHNKNIVHRDLKPENILLINKSTGHQKENTHDIKLIDFGTAKAFERNQKLTKFIGTSYYIAPEVLAESYDEKCDVWSCGVIFYILIGGYPPFNGASNIDIYHAIKFSAPNFSGDEWKGVNKDAIDLIKQMLNKNPMKRFSAEMCMNHKWFKILEDDASGSKKKDRKTTSDQNSIKAIGKMKDFVAQNKLKQAVLQYISTQFNFKEDEENLRELFSQFDTHKKGSINSAEFTALLVKMFGEVDGKNSAQHIFQTIDLDGSGEISYNEFVTALIDDRTLVTQDRLFKAFNMIDKDHSGSISIDEIRNIFGGDETKWKKIITEVDLNGDGEIDFEEFKIMMKGFEKGDLDL